MARRTLSMKNSNDIGNRTRGLPVCSAVPPSTMGTSVRWQGRDADHAPPTAKVNELSYTSNPHTPSWRAQGQLYTGFVATNVLTRKLRKGVTCAGRESDGIT